MLTLQQIRTPGTKFPQDDTPVRYKCTHWQPSDAFGTSSVLDSGNSDKYPLIVGKVVVERMEECIVYERGRYSWIVPITELQRIGLVEKEEFPLLYN